MARETERKRRPERPAAPPKKERPAPGENRPGGRRARWFAHLESARKPRSR